MTRLTRALVAACLLGMAIAGPASAAKPVSERIDLNDIGVQDEFLTEFCGFDVWSDTTGHIIFRVFVDADGNAIHEVNNFAIHVRYYSENGEVNVVDVGPDRVVYLDDGSLIVSITGSVQSITAPGQGRVYSNNGWVAFLITFDEEGNATAEFYDAAGLHSDIDQAEVLCELLAG